jgi:hypothetical protein
VEKVRVFSSPRHRRARAAARNRNSQPRAGRPLGCTYVRDLGRSCLASPPSVSPTAASGRRLLFGGPIDQARTSFSRSRLPLSSGLDRVG